MTTPQTELEKAIDVLFRISKLSHFKDEFDTVLLTAKRVPELEQRAVTFAGDAGKWAAECDNLEQRLKEVERERDEIKATCVSGLAYQSLFDELSTLRTSYKQALEAIERIKPEKDCPFCSKADEPCHECYTMARLQGRFMHVLSSPSAIAAMKGEI